MNDSDNQIRNMPLPELAQKCEQETDRYRIALHDNSIVHDPRYCFELFRRAIVNRDEDAWNAVYIRYQSQVEKWVYKNSYFSSVSEYDDPDDIVVQAFARFWKSFTSDKLGKARSLNEALNYLQMCVDSAIKDSWRKLSRRGLEKQTEDEIQNSPEPEMIPEELIQMAELWKLIKERSKDHKEYVVIFASLNLNLPPREILAEYPELFRDIKEIYQYKANALARFGNDPEIGDYFQLK